MKELTYNGVKIIRPTNDIVFKSIFGDEKNTEYLSYFLSAVLKVELDNLKTITLLDSELTPVHYLDKRPRLDIRAVLENGEHLNIEVQVDNQKSFLKRAIYYSGKLVSSQLNEGDSYDKLNKTIMISILDFKLFQDSDMWYTVAKLTDIVSKQVITDLLEFHFLELPKLKTEELSSKLELGALDSLEKWGIFFKAENEDMLRNLAKEDKYMEKTIDRLTEICSNAKVHYTHQMYEMAERDEITRLAEAKEEGFSEGISIGEERGISIGEERGEINAKKSVIKNMLLLDLDIKTIAESVNLSVNEVEKVMKEIE